MYESHGNCAFGCEMMLLLVVLGCVELRLGWMLQQQAAAAGYCPIYIKYNMLDMPVKSILFYMVEFVYRSPWLFLLKTYFILLVGEAGVLIGWSGLTLVVPL